MYTHTVVRLPRSLIVVRATIVFVFRVELPPTRIYEDNAAVTRIFKRRSVGGRMRHIRINISFTLEPSTRAARNSRLPALRPLVVHVFDIIGPLRSELLLLLLAQRRRLLADAPLLRRQQRRRRVLVDDVRCVVGRRVVVGCSRVRVLAIACAEWPAPGAC